MWNGGSAVNQYAFWKSYSYSFIVTFVFGAWYVGSVAQNLQWKLGQQTPSVGTILAYLETTTVGFYSIEIGKKVLHLFENVFHEKFHDGFLR